MDKKIKFLLVIFFYIALQFSILIPIYLFKINTNNTSMEVITLLSLFQSVIFAIVLGIMYRKELEEDYISFNKDRKELLKKAVKYWLLGMFLMVVSNLLIANFSPIKEANNEVGIRNAFKGSPIPMLISIVFLAPFTEEIMFRKSLGDILKNKYLYITISGLLFGLAHIVGSYKVIWDFLYVFPYGFLGVAFALLYYETKNMYTSILAHMLHNAFATSMIVLLMITGEV